MSIFDDLIRIDENGNLSYNGWIEWDHFLIPNKPEWFREILRNLMALLGHCLNCTALDGCYLLDTNCPKQPLHERCHCKKNNVSFSVVKKIQMPSVLLKSLQNMYLKVMAILKAKIKFSMIWDILLKIQNI